mmetsp:Transcript_8382/g.16636  ORF Transcript_8382/g.16636 Transcript_8382/m.16636 type:complete len:1637 (+) Transcript_8382:5150-10060(+)
MWITNPNNFFIGNHVAGSDAYGFWFDLQDHPTGPSFTDQICPIHMKLGEFKGNAAHSVVKYGLRIFHEHIPLTYPCQPIKDDSLEDPWSANPPVTAIYEDFTAYKCHRDGAIGEKLGDVRWKNFKVADNKIAGLEMTYTSYSKPYETALIYDALIIGASANTDSESLDGAIGLITPQTDGLKVQKVQFHNFADGLFPLGDMSHSSHLAVRDTGARLTRLTELSFTNSNKKISWGIPPTGFFEILDSSLTGTANAYVAAYWPHLLDGSCTYSDTDKTTYNAVVCDGTKKIRRVLFYSVENMNVFGFKPITVRRSSGDNIPVKPASRRFLTTDEPDYLWSSIDMQRGGQYKNPSLAWGVPFILGYEYNVHFGNTPADWDSHKISIDQFEAEDEWVQLNLNFTDHREHFQVNRGTVPAGTDTTAADYVDPTLIPLSTTELTSTMDSGSARFDNVTKMEFEIMLNGIEGTVQKGPISVKAFRCYGKHCTLTDEEEPVVQETFVRKWSDPGSWSSGKVPVDGETVTIPPEWDMLLDTNTAILGHLEVNGKITFSSTQSVTLNSNTIFIRRGVISSGTAEVPTPASISHQIILHGTFKSKSFAFDPYIEVVNKALIVTGQLNLYGAKRDGWKRLVQNVKPGENYIFVEKGGWRVGDEIVITASSFEVGEFETAKVIAVFGEEEGQVIATDSNWAAKEATRKFGVYDSEVYPHKVVPSNPTGSVKLSLDKSLKYYHSGTAMLVAGSTIETRAEVGQLTSNIRIAGIENGWTCNIVVADFQDFNTGSNPILRSGQVNLENVEIDYCGQKDTVRAGLRFEKTTKASVVKNSIVKRSQTYSVYLSEASKITLIGNVFYQATRFGVVVLTADSSLIDGNLMVNVTQRENVDIIFDKPTAFLICPEKYASCSTVQINNNVASSYALFGFNYGSYQCGGNSNAVNNLAHTGTVGLIVEHLSSSCNQVDGFTAYFNTDTGVLGAQKSSQVIFKGIKAIENAIGFIANIGKQGDSGNIAKISDSVFGGQTVHSYCDPSNCKANACLSRHGIGFGTYGTSKSFSSFNAKMMMSPSDVDKDPAFSGEFRYSNIYLGNFKNSAICGSKQTALVSNPNSPDFSVPQIFTNVLLDNVAEDSLFYMNDPKPGWANLDDCGEFPCTGPLNVLVRDTDGSLSSNATTTYLLPNNPGVALKDSCTFIAKSNGYVCKKTKLQNFDYSVLVFESLDDDRYDRTFSPIYITSDDFVLSAADGKYYNKLNTFMDHVWDGFYTGQKRLSRFPTIIPFNRFINITATGTWPDKMRYHLAGSDDNVKDSSVITIQYQHPFTIVLYKNGVKQSPLQVTENDSNHVSLNSASGSHKWFPESRLLQFNARAGDIYELRTVQSIQLTVRMDMTPAQFFADDGVTNFIDRLAAALGIPVYRIRVAQVKEGSTIVYAEILTNDEKTESEQKVEAQSIKSTIETKAQDGTLSLNAPILSLSVGISSTASTVASTDTDTPTTFTPGTVVDDNEDSEDSSSDDDNDEKDKDMPKWAIIVTACGGFGVLAGLAVLLLCYLRRSSKFAPVSVQLSPRFEPDEVVMTYNQKGEQYASSMPSNVPDTDQYFLTPHTVAKKNGREQSALSFETSKSNLNTGERHEMNSYNADAEQQVLNFS